MVKPGWFHGARGGERPVQARLRQPGLGPFQFGGKTSFLHPEKLQMAFLSVIMSPFFICRWLFTCWCLVVGNPFGTEATSAQSRIRWRRRLQTIQKLLPIKISTKFRFSFVIIREYSLNFQVSFAHPEFSGVSAEAKDFIRSKKLERFLFWWFRNNFLLEWCVRSFISGLLEKQQSRRMTGNQCLGHSWIRQAMSDNIWQCPIFVMSGNIWQCPIYVISGRQENQILAISGFLSQDWVTQIWTSKVFALCNHD